MVQGNLTNYHILIYYYVILLKPVFKRVYELLIDCEKDFKANTPALFQLYLRDEIHCFEVSKTMMYKISVVFEDFKMGPSIAFFCKDDYQDI